MPAPLKAGEQGAIVYDHRPPSNSAMRFKLEVVGGNRNLSQEFTLEAKPIVHVVRYSTRNAWITAKMFFVNNDGSQLKGQAARAYAQKVAAFGFEVKIRYYTDAIPFSRDHDTVLCRSVNWLERTFDSKADADAFARSLRNIVPDTVAIEHQAVAR